MPQTDPQQVQQCTQRFVAILSVFTQDGTPTMAKIKEAQELIPLLAKVCIAATVQDPKRVIPMLDFFVFIAKQEPRCLGSGDPRVIGPTLQHLVLCLTRANIDPIQSKIVDCIASHLQLIGAGNMHALQAAVSDLVDFLTDLLSIAHEASRGGLLAADGGGLQVVCMGKFGRLAGRAEAMVATVPSADAALCGAASVLKCLQSLADKAGHPGEKDAKGAGLCCEFVFRSCVDKLWPALRSPARGDAGNEARLTVLEIVDYLLVCTLTPDFADSILSVLAAALSTPGSEFWTSYTPGARASPAEMICRCLRHGPEALVVHSATPPSTGLSDYASIVRGNLLENSAVPNVGVAVCDFFADLLRACPSTTMLTAAIQLFPCAWRTELPAYNSVISCLQEAVRCVEVDDDGTLCSAPGLTASDELGGVTARPGKRARLDGAVGSRYAADREKGAPTAVDSSDQLVAMIHEALETALPAPESIETPRAGWLPDCKSMIVAASIVRIQLARPQIFDWRRVLTRLDGVISVALERSPHGASMGSNDLPSKDFVQFWLVVVQVLSELLCGLTLSSAQFGLDPFERKFTQYLAVSLQDPFRQAAGSQNRDTAHRTATAKLICLSLRALTVPHRAGKTKISYKTLESFLKPENVHDCSVSIAIEAVQICPFVAAATPAKIGNCFKSLATLLQTSLDRRMDLHDASELQTAIGRAVGPLCCSLAAAATHRVEPAVVENEPSSTEWRCCCQCDRRQATGHATCRVAILKYLQPFALLLDESMAARDATESYVYSLCRVFRHANMGELKSGQGSQTIQKWLALISHPAAQMRQALVKSIGVLMEDECACVHAAFGAMPKLVEFMERSIKGATTPGVREDFLQGLGRLARHRTARRDLTSLVLTSLLGELTDGNHVNSVIAYEEIFEIANARSSRPGGKRDSSTVKSLFESVKDELYVGLALSWFQNSSESEATRRFTLVAELLELKLEDFKNQVVTIALPTLVSLSAEKVLQNLSNFAKTPLAQLILVKENANKIMSAGLLHEGVDHPTFLKFFAKCVRGRQKDAIGMVVDSTSYTTEAAVWEMGKVEPVEAAPRDRAVRCLQFLAKCGKERDIKTLLKKHLPLLLEHLNGHLVGWRQNRQETMTSSQNGEHALRSLKSVIQIMKEQLVNFLPAITSTLKIVLARPGLQATALDVWLSLVQGVPATNFGPHLSQIVGHLLPILPTFPTECLRVLKFLIVDKRHELSEFFCELSFVPQEPLLQSLNDSIKAEIGSLAVPQRLQQLLLGMGNESATVRALALNQLQIILRDMWTDIAELVRGPAEIVHPVISNLVTQLRIGCSDADVKVQRLSMQCFGELGAIDPSKLPADSTHRTAVQQSKLKHTELVATLINDHLVKVMKAAKGPIEHDRAAFAIQELLKIGQCTEDTVRKYNQGQRPGQGQAIAGLELWHLLQESTRNIVYPLLSTKYKIDGASKFVFPGFAAYKGRNHQKWVKDWAYHLISVLSDEAEKTSFLACRTVIKMDIDTAHFLLPYLVWEAIWHSPSDQVVTEIRHEMFALLEATLDTKQVVESQLILFSLLDKLTAWVREEKHKRASEDRRSGSRRSGSRSNEWIKLDQVLRAIPRLDLARAALQCKAYQRALMNFEVHLREAAKDGSSRSHIGQVEFKGEDLFTLQKIYTGLNVSDGLAGVAAKRPGSSTSLQETIIDHEAAGRWSDAITCYNVQIQQQSNPGELGELHDGLMTCMRQLGHFEAVLSHARCIISVPGPNGGNENGLSSVNNGIEHAAAAAWRLGNWDVIKEVEQHTSTDKGLLEVCVASILRRLNDQSGESNICMTDINNDIQRVRRRMAPAMSAACMESYERAYPMIADLHLLQELEFSCHSELVGLPSATPRARAMPFDEQMHLWAYRLRLTTPGLRLREPVLAVRRAILSHSLDKVAANKIGDAWLQLATTARIEASQKLEGGADQLHAAASALLQPATKYCGALYHIEKAKLLWDQGNTHDAVRELEDQIEKCRGHGTRPDHYSKASHAAMELLLAEYVESTGKKHSEQVVAHFKHVIKLRHDWDKGHFAYAQYLDKMYQEATKKPTHSTTHMFQVKKKTKVHRVASPYQLLPEVIHSYGQSLVYGHSYIFQCLPRLLTLWFEFGDKLLEAQQGSSAGGSVGTRTGSRREEPGIPADMAKVASKVNAIIEQLLSTIPSYQWFTALPQLISRTGHRHNPTQALLKNVIATIVAKHPVQAAWHVVPATQTKNKFRANTAAEIIRDAKAHLGRSTPNRSMLDSADSFIKALIELSEYKIPDTKEPVRKLSIKDTPALARLNRHTKGLTLIVPSQTAMTVVLPSDAVSEHQPFDNAHVRIDRIDDDLVIMSSLQKPRKITFRGSDGKRYDFLCKLEDKGDIRKDSRLMEFSTMINRLFQDNIDSRQRSLNLRTYAVHPLNEHGGLIEWVPNTETLRSILGKLYRDRKCGKSTKEIQDGYNAATKEGKGSNEDEVRWLQGMIPKTYPPVFRHWLMQQFPDPNRWLSSRLTCARSIAVWSMVGYILGLGDRHAENILFDASSGQAVHVDFSMLFEQGISLAKPEVVPFRLTHNLVDVMGVTGVEGVYRQACETSMRILRANRGLLAANLETFMHDPLVEWHNAANGQGLLKIQPNQKAERMLARVRAKLTGQGGSIEEVFQGLVVSHQLPLSVNGQVHRLIEEATSIEKLSSMYVWWMPWF